MLDRYFTVKGFGETEIVINRSRFICYADRVESEEEAFDFISKIKKKHWDATHNCSAYLIGEQNQVQKADDDGEPSGTAGKPILEVLKKNQVKDTVVVVTRYFGGIKLGAGGLIRAYGKGATAALQAALRVERLLHKTLHFKIDYTFLGKIENGFRAKEHVIVDQISYLDAVTVTALVPTHLEVQLREWMTNSTNGQVITEAGDDRYVEFSLEAEES